MNQRMTITTWFFVDGRVDWFLYCDDGYWCKDYGLASMTGRVTHWMPLPEPPCLTTEPLSHHEENINNNYTQLK